MIFNRSRTVGENLKGRIPNLRWIFSNGKVLDVTEDIRDKGIGEQPIRLARHVIGHSMALDLVFLELGARVVEGIISKMQIGIVLSENDCIVVCTKEFFQDDLLSLHIRAYGKAALA